MPIKGLTDRGMAFPMIGRIRKGGKKTEANKPGPDLTYFRVEFDPNEVASEQTFMGIYTEKPQSIDFYLPPSETMDDMASFWLEAYTAGRMVARADGEIYQYLIDTKTNKVLVQNGELVDHPGMVKHYDPQEPCGSYIKQSTGEVMPIFCKPVGRIRMVIPQLRRAAWLMFMTSSKHDCINLSSQIAALTKLPYNISTIPLILTRKPREISCPDGKVGRARRTKWLVNIEINPVWFGKLLDHQEKTQFLDSNEYRRLSPGIKAAGEQWDNVPITDEFVEDDGLGEDEGDLIPEPIKHGSFPDLDLLAERDPVTAFWHTVNRIGMEKEMAEKILGECNAEFGKAYQAIQTHIPPA